MSTYRLEVHADIPRGRGEADDLAGAVVYAVEDLDIEVTGAAARRVPGTDLVAVAVTFTADDDTAAIEFRKALPFRIRGYSAEATNLRTGRGKSFRRLP